MADQKRFAVVQLAELLWPASIALPGRRFRLFVAADTRGLSVDAMSDFATAALSKGMVYFSAWGSGSERFHDIVDEVVAEDRLGERRFVGATPNDVAMTTWHEDEDLEGALSFFAVSAIPTEGFSDDSDFRLVICVGNPDWAQAADRLLRSAQVP